MSDVSIRVENLSKQYRIHARQEGYKTIRETLTNAFGAPFRRIRKSNANYIWALKNVSFQVKRGEVVGIIGRNGAGKSTLLKLLSRITEPTEGKAEVHGRVGTLLEVGIGFHPELTGRENIYLNGAILGMKRAEINRRFDEIVAFAEVEKFIDTPVKHYSSGMYLRLAFAVASHLETDILVVDEVLAVGDTVFQRRCLNKMESVGHQGRAVLFVSHNIEVVTRLCERTILLDAGGVVQDGPSYQVVSAYLKNGIGVTSSREWHDLDQAPGNDIVRLRAVRVLNEDRTITSALDIRRPVGIEMEYEVLKDGYVLCPHFTLDNEKGTRLFVSFDVDPAWRGRPRAAGHYVSTGWIPGNFLAEGTMCVGPSIRTESPKLIHFWARNAVAFQVVDSLDGDSARGDILEHFDGVVRPLLKWDTRFSTQSAELSNVATK
jgi:lipopolysaccharide transport system ATP-binding protein